MNENHPDQPAPSPSPDRPDQPERPDHRDPAAAPAPRRRRAGLITGCAVLLLALVGGTGYTVAVVRDADRSPGAPVWRMPEPAAAGQRQDAATGLKGMLLPYGTQEFVRGPDIGEFGTDAELSGAQATELRKQALRNLPLSQRRQLAKEIDKQQVKGMVMRSYLSNGDAAHDAYYADHAFTVEIVLARMGSSRTVRSVAGFQQQFFEALKVFRAGPRIEGHKNARCFLMPTDSKEKLDAMTCSAYEGDVMVSATMQAAKPLDTKGAAEMLRDQLDRIKEPGQAV
ncbi:hypothetical protein [Streptomyces sp. PsTaAH-124]|uniref:hypothetical protein n=1 Tax=Streptomyces sp. PsTaAH-124 TaxID=1157638 RepID=UPI00035D66BF|nr:hypothetical protein [Streptomyces sp. PsTaAH-124]